MRPPLDFNPLPSPNERLLHIVRISDSVTQGLITTGRLTGKFDRTFTISIVDANITFHVVWTDIKFAIPPGDDSHSHFNLSMRVGTIVGVCTSRTNPENYGKVRFAIECA